MAARANRRGLPIALSLMLASFGCVVPGEVVSSVPVCPPVADVNKRHSPRKSSDCPWSPAAEALYSLELLLFHLLNAALRNDNTHIGADYSW